MPGVVDRMIQVPDAASIAAMRLVHEVTGRSVGGSTGTDLWGALGSSPRCSPAAGTGAS